MVLWAQTEQHKNKVSVTVIPAPRKSVKRMMAETLVRFIAALFSCKGNLSEEDSQVYFD